MDRWTETRDGAESQTAGAVLQAGLVGNGVGDAAAACLFSRVVMMLDLFLDVHGLTFSTLPPCRAVGVCMFTGGAQTHSVFFLLHRRHGRLAIEVDC